MTTNKFVKLTESIYGEVDGMLREIPWKPDPELMEFDCRGINPDVYAKIPSILTLYRLFGEMVRELAKLPKLPWEPQMYDLPVDVRSTIETARRMLLQSAVNDVDAIHDLGKDALEPYADTMLEYPFLVPPQPGPKDNEYVALVL